MDLLDGGLIEENVDPVATSELIMDSYRRLWDELTEKESFEIGERWRVAARIRKLNELGFDVEEFAIKTTQNGSTIAAPAQGGGRRPPPAPAAAADRPGRRRKTRPAGS